ncbi:hypothetical protein KM792_02575 [Clostridium tyrobutyricum]|jgi:hypothetical protein|uniref:hypothetical protein n=1 Tax=Clostridium tyrobutyricum TaxID=1519 RepID=UPI00057C9815|nr:hypothetical protein [Clostridium tyrobutyricum]MBR9648434.1 hypothetical protein [Clostridium tyrobutyricum]MBV4424207.1 hypothetical protein [Clostridium tyrobutyricum]MBV4428788.1 hypothetical protein [Clostridium tyrobutyricum]MBV4430624.1 hypothetical protein [Clostridium tyrobutyricum]MBV4437163.1 hypothetical protein [Clostridium tyrobutyricum]
MDKMEFKKFIEHNLKEVLEAGDIKEAFKILCENTVAYYEGTQVVFSQKFTKRIEYIIGAGKETFMPQEKVELNDKYTVFLQSFENVSDYEKDILISLFKLCVVIK